MSDNPNISNDQDYVNIPNASFAITPCYILDDTDIEDGAKTLYSRISMYSSEGMCWASNQHFADKQKVSIRCIQTWLAQLKDKGYIIVELDKSGFQTKRIIWTTIDFKKHFTKRSTVHPGMKPRVHPDMNHSSPPPAPHCTSSIYKDKHDKKFVCVPPPVGVDTALNPRTSATPQTADLELEDFIEHCKTLPEKWSRGEIETAWETYELVDKKIAKPLSYLEGILKNQRKLGIFKKQKGMNKCNQKNKKKDLNEMSSTSKESITAPVIRGNPFQNFKCPIISRKDCGLG